MVVQRVLDSMPDSVFSVDREMRITAFNFAAEQLTGFSRSEVLGRLCSEVFKASLCDSDCAVRRAITSGESVTRCGISITTAEGRIPVCVSAGVLRSETGKIIGAIQTLRDLTRVDRVRMEGDDQPLPGFVGCSPAITRLCQLVRLVAPTGSTICIEGESGTGKELVARAIHGLSAGADRRLVTVNCGALPETLLESELFGHRAGSFTDARADKPGRFELADGGTIFLDEIGEVSPALQLRLLRVIQEREIEPIGCTTPVSVNVRILAATNRNLLERVERGLFRSDLYYRLNVVTITVPPLRERLEDVPLLAEAFRCELNDRVGREIEGVSAEAMSILLAHDYPGNVRELQNILEHAAIFCPDGVIYPHHLPKYLARRRKGASEPCDPVLSLQRAILTSALARHGGNRSAAARELGIHATTLWRRAQRLGITLPEQDGRTPS